MPGKNLAALLGAVRAVRLAGLDVKGRAGQVGAGCTPAYVPWLPPRFLTNARSAWGLNKHSIGRVHQQITPNTPPALPLAIKLLPQTFSRHQRRKTIAEPSRRTRDALSYPIDP
jgi:hypothetical protein